MAKSTSTSAPSETQTNTIKRIVSPLTALTNLDGYMSASGYDVGHPWRTEIATALAAPADVDSSIDHALAVVNAADLGVSIINELGTLIGTIDALAKGSEPTQDGARKQLDAIRRLARFACLFAADRSGDYSLTRDEAHDALAALKGGAV
jgi:hypothetical protein